MTSETNSIIRQLRRAAHLTQAELAARINCSQSWISDLEQERDGIPLPSTVYRVARHCGVDLRNLVRTYDGWIIRR